MGNSTPIIIEWGLAADHADLPGTPTGPAGVEIPKGSQKSIFQAQYTGSPTTAPMAVYVRNRFNQVWEKLDETANLVGLPGNIYKYEIPDPELYDLVSGYVTGSTLAGGKISMFMVCSDTPGGKSVPGGVVSITPRVGANPTVTHMKDISFATDDLCVQGYLSDADSDTACDMTLFARERDNARIIQLDGGKFEDMEVAGNESFAHFVSPGPVGMVYDKIGARWDSVGGNSPVYTCKFRQKRL